MIAEAFALTLEEARQILNMVRNGIPIERRFIDMALIRTGDLTC